VSDRGVDPVLAAQLKCQAVNRSSDLAKRIIGI
jgi:hypothetical protein